MYEGFCLYFQTQENLMRLFVLDGFWLIHIPFGSTVKFYFLAQFPVDHLPT